MTILRVICRNCGHLNHNLKLPASKRFRFVCSKCSTLNIALYINRGPSEDFLVPTRNLKDSNGYMNISNLKREIEETILRSYDYSYETDETDYLEDSPFWDVLTSEERFKMKS